MYEGFKGSKRVRETSQRRKGVIRKLYRTLSGQLNEENGNTETSGGCPDKREKEVKMGGGTRRLEKLKWLKKVGRKMKQEMYGLVEKG